MTTLRRIWKVGVAVSAISIAAHAQGVLTVAPGRSATTTAGAGALGYTGDGGAAAAATLASPSAIAYDVSGNLYLADTNNHVIREVLKSNGNLVTVAGTGTAGFSGDGGAATSANLDTPISIALDASGNLYIADSHNHRIREVSGGVITTVAGTGTAGSSGDGAAASAAQLALPSAVALDGSGNLYIADTDNNRIRKVSGGTIMTVAGNGEELFAGDGGAAIAASLDLPTGVAVDASGNLYIADRHNHRIRVVNPSGTIFTFAGSGAATLGGGYSGDGASAAAAMLSKPTGVSVDTAGNVYVADTNNERIRQISGGAIASVAGTGEQGFAGDGGLLTNALLNAPRAVALDSTGNLLIADTLNQRLRSGNLPTLTFVSQTVGVSSAAQNITLANTGTASLTVSKLSISGAFTTVTGGSCSAPPVSLAPGASCTESIAFLPTSSGAASGSITVSGDGMVPQTVLLAGSAVQSTTTTTLAADHTSALLGQPVVFTATVKPAGSGLPGGTVSFYDGATQIGTAQSLANNAASLTVSTLSTGTHSVTAVYSGDASFTGSTSTPLPELIGDFDFTIVPNPSNPAGALNQTVVPGQPANFALTVQPLAGPFNFPVTLSATGLPPGATVTFSPQTVTVGAAPANFTMTIQTAAASAALEPSKLFGGGTVAFALLLPFSGTVRRRAKQLGPLTMIVFLLGSGAVLATLTGCGSGNGFFGQPQRTYTIDVVGTAHGTNGATLQHVTSVKLVVQ